MSLQQFPSAWPERFTARVAVAGNGCWIWTGYVSVRGYGMFSVGGSQRTRFAHRWAYEQAVGPVRDGMQLDHLCRNRACVRPEHLEPVTPGENVRRGLSKNRDTCQSGRHPWIPENIVYQEGRGKLSPLCRPCRDERMHAWRTARRQKPART